MVEGGGILDYWSQIYNNRLSHALGTDKELTSARSRKPATKGRIGDDTAASQQVLRKVIFLDSQAVGSPLFHSCGQRASDTKNIEMRVG